MAVNDIGWKYHGEDGITHNEAEYVSQDDAVPSVNVLLHAVLARANR